MKPRKFIIMSVNAAALGLQACKGEAGRDGGPNSDGGPNADGGASSDGANSDGGAALDSGATLDGGAALDGGSTVVPDWAPQTGGELKLVTPTNTFVSTNPNLPGWASAYVKIFDFSGGVYNPFWGPLGAMVLHGGGHSATYDNSVVLLDYNDLTWKRVTDPSAAFTDTNPDPLFDETYCEYGDGQPGSCHSYDTLAILSPSDGGGPKGSLLRVSSHAVHVRMSRDTSWSHACDLAAGTWRRYSTNGFTNGLSPGATSAYDSLRKRYWWFASPSNGNALIRYLDVATRTHSQVDFAAGGVPYAGAIAFGGSPDSGVMRYHPGRDVLIVTGTNRGALLLAYLDCANPVEGWKVPSLSSAIPITAGFSTPFDYVLEADKFVVFSPADAGAAYDLRVPSTLTDPWVVTRQPFTGVTTNPIAYVAGKRWSYSPTTKSFVWVSSATGDIYAYRPAGV